MKKFVLPLICVFLFVFNTCVFAAEDSLIDVNLSECNEIKISYYNGGEFLSLTDSGFYNYVTTDKQEIEQIIKCLSNIQLTPLSGGYVQSGGESMTVFINGEEVICFSPYDSMCYVGKQCCKFDMEGYHNLEQTVLEYKSKNETNVYLNNEKIFFYNSPVIINDRTLVPAENISRALNFELDGDRTKIIFKNENLTMIFYNEQDSVNINDKSINIDVGCQVIDGIAMVPIRVLAESYGYTVDWKNNSVYIISE